MRVIGEFGWSDSHETRWNSNDGLLVDKCIECHDRHALYDNYSMKRWAVVVMFSGQIMEMCRKYL